MTGVIPAGFRRMDVPQVNTIGTVHGRVAGDGFEIAYLVEARACNLIGVCHGGILMSLADMSMGTACNVPLGALHHLPTISLNVDFMQGAKLGEVIIAKAEVMKQTRRIGFARAELRVGEALCMTASGVFRLPTEGAAPFGPLETVFAVEAA